MTVLLRRVVAGPIMVELLALSACSATDRSGTTLPPKVEDLLGAEPSFDTDIRWDAETETVSIDRLVMRFPRFEQSSLEAETFAMPVVTSLYLDEIIDGQREARVAIGVLRQTFLATDGADQILSKF